MDTVAGGFHEFSSQEDLNSEGYDQSITTSSSSSSENELLSPGPSDEYEEYEEREEGGSVPFNTNSYLEDDASGSVITDVPKPSSVNMKKQQKLNKKEMKEFYKLSSHMAQLAERFEEKEKQLQQTVKELSQCREFMDKLGIECQQTEKALEEALRQNIVSPGTGLLKLQLEKAKKELSFKQCHEEELKAKISELELDLLEVQLLQSTDYDSSSVHEQQKTIIQQHKHKQGLLRVQTQAREVIEAQRRDLKEERDKRHRKVATIKTVHSTQKSEKLQQYLMEKSVKLKVQRTADKEREQVDRDKRIKALLSLKKNIESSKESLHAQQLLLKEKERTALKQEEEERLRLATERSGEDPTIILMKKKKQEKINKDKLAFEEKQKKRQAEIVAQLLDETKRLDKQSEEQRNALSSCMKKTTTVEKKKAFKIDKREEETQQEEDGVIREQNDGIIEKADSEKLPTPTEDPCFAIEKTLLQPDIPGLWELHTEEKRTKQMKQSKMEQSIMEKTFKKLKDSVITTQVAAGKVFKGQHSFLSKPEEIIFKDFDVGKVYKKKLQLTNVSYSISHVKLLGVSDNLKDFIQIKFTPPGAMSAGLTCPLFVTFEPKVNEDITGSIDFMSQTGPFSIKVMCLTKKCMVVVNKSEIVFGRVYTGERIKRSITVHNNGALPTDFTFLSADQMGDIYAEEVSVIHEQDEAPLTGSQRSILSTVEYATDQKVMLLKGALDNHGHSMSNLDSFNSKSKLDSSKKSGIGSSQATKTQKENKESSIIDEEKISKGGHNNGEESGQDDPVTLAVSEESVEKDEEETIATVNPITVGEVSSGVIPPYSSVVLDLIFSPIISGSYQSQFVLDTTNEPICIVATGEGIDVPIFTEQEIIDLHICMTDLLYQDSVILHNRSRTALQATFSIPPLVSDYMEIIPKYGLVQGGSSFSAQLKFLPRASLLSEESSELFVGGVLKVPISIIVAGQSLPVIFTVLAVVTESDIGISQTTLDFGQCTIHESVFTSIQLTNKSCLPQDFGFVHLPKWLSVQPNDGFGTLLPHETLSVDVIFTPDTPKDYYTDAISCLTAINKEYKLIANGTGIQTSLKLSHSNILFSDTPLNAMSLSRISILNPSLSSTNRAVFKDLTPSKGSKMFQFHVPLDNLPISVSPAVGIVEPGKSVDIEICFNPKLDEQDIKEANMLLAKEEAAAIAARKAEEERIASAKEEDKQSKVSKSKVRRGGGSNKSPSDSDSVLSGSSLQHINPEQNNNNGVGDASEISTRNNESRSMWWKAYNQLLTVYEDTHYRCLLPCFVSNSLNKITTNNQHKDIEYRSEETLYVDISATAIKPSLILVTNNGCATIDFGDVGVGSYCRKSIEVKNISSQSLKVHATSMRRGFEMRNSLREMPPDSTHSIILQFDPETSGKFYETLLLNYGASSYLELTLLGHGIEPVVHVTPAEGPVDWGCTSAGDTVSKSIHIKNASEVKVEFCLKAEKDISSSYNCNGQPVFTCVPCTGLISPKSCNDISIQFSPDRPDCVFSETLHIEINSKKILSLVLRGQSVSGNMYVSGGIAVGSSDVSMTAVSSTDTGSGTLTSHPVLFVFKYNTTDANTSSQQLVIGAAKTSLGKKPKSEYVIETLQGNPNDTKCFTVDPMKSSLDAGEVKEISITFQPRKDSMATVIQAYTNVLLKGEVTMQHQLFLQAIPMTSQD